MPVHLSTTDKLAQTAGVKVCIHGRSGAGKTRLIATAPRPFILSAERGTLSIAGAALPVATITCIADLNDVYNWLRTSNELSKYDTICIDSISEIAEKILSEEKKRFKDPRQAYGELSDQLQAFIRLYRDTFDKNVYMSCKSALLEQPDKTVLYSALLPGKANSQGLAYYFDEFLYLGVADAPDTRAGMPPGATYQYRYLQTRLSNQIDAKDRSGTLELMEEPHLGKLFDKIRAGKVLA